MFCAHVFCEIFVGISVFRTPRKAVSVYEIHRPSVTL